VPARTKPALDVIRIKNAVFYAYHGVLSDEQNLGGRFEIDLDLYADLRKGAESDHLRDTVDYEKVYDYVRSSVLGKKYFLLEGLGSAIIRGIFAKFKQVKRVTVRVRKPNAPVKGVIDTVEVEMTRSR
jgi:dihydroneopterin aldolase